MASATARQLICSQTNCHNIKKHHLLFAHNPISEVVILKPNDDASYQKKLPRFSLVLSNYRNVSVLVKSSAGKDSAISADDDGVSLGTMRLPLDVDIPRFETLLFQWANSLCQGAQLPLPVPLKSTGSDVRNYISVISHIEVDKIEGGVRLGFVEIDDGKSQVPVYINCIVIPGTNNFDNPPIFIASRNGARKNKVPPGEPRIMKSLLAALQKSIEIARV